MYQLLYTTNMQPVNHGDVVHFSQRAWTVEDIVSKPSYLDCWVWVRSMDEQHLCIKVTGSTFGARFIQTRPELDRDIAMERRNLALSLRNR